MANHLQGTLTHSVYEEFTKISTYCILTKQKTERNTHQKGQRYNLPSVIQRINKENKQREINKENLFPTPTFPPSAKSKLAHFCTYWTKHCTTGLGQRNPILDSISWSFKYYIYYYPDIVQTSANAQHHWKTEHHLGRSSRSELPVYARHEVSAFLFFDPFYVSHPGLGRMRSASVITTHKKISITADDCRAQSLPRPGSSLCF